MKLDFPATQRNRGPLLEVLQEHLGPKGVILEVASGSGQHAAAFAPSFPEWTWVPSDLDPRHLASIDAWCASLPTVRPALSLDVLQPWPVGRADAVFCANMIHIAPWACTEALLVGSARVLHQGGLLLLYGPFRRDGAHTSPSNASFDESLRSRDPEWGVRDLEAVVDIAAGVGLHVERVHAMPANNLTVVFRTQGVTPGPPDV
ncbi:MAG: DUF938 domain-containing protein [Myxococcales bacterium]|nr:DUF938 domain-containing protein [Myxococcales bacterium]